jgi:hypothetical protein
MYLTMVIYDLGALYVVNIWKKKYVCIIIDLLLTATNIYISVKRIKNQIFNHVLFILNTYERTVQ